MFMCVYVLQLLGLHSESGTVLWAAPVSGLRPSSASSVVLGLQRGTAHFPHPPLAVLLAGDTLVTFNPITGAELTVQKLPYQPAQASLLPHTTNTHLKVRLIPAAHVLKPRLTPLCPLVQRCHYQYRAVSGVILLVGQYHPGCDVVASLCCSLFLYLVVEEFGQEVVGQVGR